MMLSAPAWSQTGDPVPPIRLGIVEDSTDGILGYGIPYEHIFNTEFGEPDAPWNNFLKGNGFSFDPTVKLGNATATGPNFGFDYGSNFAVPIVSSGFAPDDAKIKLGPLYINYNNISFQLLASDNVNATVDDRESGVIAMVTSGFDVTLQLTEGLQVSASSAFIWLPFENEAGLDGFGTPRDNYGLGFDAGANAGLELGAEYAFTIGGWDVSWNGSFTKDRRSYGAQYTYANDLMRDQQAFDFDGEDVAGRYRFGNGPQARETGDRDGEVSGFEDSKSSSDDWELTNDVIISRRVPIDQSVYAYLEGAFSNSLHEEGDGYLLSSTSERYTVQLTSERENTRFTPFVTYSAARSYDNRSPDDEMDDWSHTLRVGVTGPVTENIFLYADFGYTLSEFHDEDIEDTESEVYTFGLTHVINPYLTHAISLRRSVDNDHNLSDTLNYTLTYILGPRLHGYFSYEQSETFSRNNDKGRGRETSWRQSTLANLTWDYSSRTTVVLEGRHTNTRQYVDNVSIGDIEEWRIELQLNYEVSDTVELTLSAIHTEEERLRSDHSGERIVENLLLLMLTKQL